MNVQTRALADPQRLASLRRTGLLDSPPEEAFDRLTRLASRLLDARVALVSLVDDKRQFFKSLVGVAEPWATVRETPLSHSYCQYVVSSGTPLVVSDAREHPVLRESPAIKDVDAIAYCGIPVVDMEDRVLGTLCVLDEEPREWSSSDVAALQDVAKSVIAEVHLRLLATELQAANSALVEFLAVASHDIRNPLGIIGMYADLLTGRSGEVSDDDRMEFATAIRLEVGRADRLIASLLQVTQLQTNVIQTERSDVPIRGLLEVIVGSLAVSDGLRVAVTAPEGLEAFADPDHVRRIVTNLITNALKYGDPPFRVEAAEADGSVRIVVSDAGPGVPPEFVPRLFDKFTRSDEARRSDEEGTGLGLAIVAGLAELNGGSVSYEPNVPTGSRFVVELPRSGREAT